ncbi:MAG: hypothetical protein AAGL90_08575 [Pseudomonadota bacterium]
MKPLAIFGSLIGIAAMTTFTAVAQAPDGYESGVGALEYFDQDAMANTPLWIQIWIGIMLATFAASLFFVWKQPIARWALGGFLMPFLVMSYIIDALGWPFLSGSIALAHLLFWTPALILLLWKRPFLNADHSKAFRVWSAAITGVILFSFVFDIRDAVIYVSHFAA